MALNGKKQTHTPLSQNRLMPAAQRLSVSIRQVRVNLCAIISRYVTIRYVTNTENPDNSIGRTAGLLLMKLENLLRLPCHRFFDRWCFFLHHAVVSPGHVRVG